MVLPLVDESRPKCYLCHEGFDGLENLRKHLRIAHADSEARARPDREPAPGDVTVF